MSAPGLYLVGTLVAAEPQPEVKNRKTGEVYAAYNALQVQYPRRGGLVALETLQVPDLTPYKGKKGQEVTLRVRAAAVGNAVRFYVADE